MAARLFGFSIEDNEKNPPGLVSPVPPSNADVTNTMYRAGFSVLMLILKVYIKQRMI